MKTLALDLSTNCGIAFFDGCNLKTYFNIKKKVEGDENSDSYPNNFIEMADFIAEEIGKTIKELRPDFIIIEETNLGNNRYHQKQLEFIHFAVNKKINSIKLEEKIFVAYVSTSFWRSVLGISLDKEQRKNNKGVKEQREAAKKETYDKIFKVNESVLFERLKGITSKLESNRINKEFRKEIEKQTRSEMRKLRTGTSKVTFKHLSVQYANSHFNLNLKVKDNDLADAICIGCYFLKKIKVL